MRERTETNDDSADFNPFATAENFEQPQASEPKFGANIHVSAPLEAEVQLTAAAIATPVPEAPAPAASVTPTRETYSELQDAYDFFNRRLYEGRLPNCLITLQGEKKSMGYYIDKKFVRRSGETTDEIAMNPRYFGTCSVRETLSTLVQQMVHLWQQHFGTASRRGYHNKEWADEMERIGLMPSHNGQPDGKKVGEKMTHYIITGGAFDVACTALLNQGFSLSWMDRYPAARFNPPITPEAAAAAGMHLPGPAEVAEVEAAEMHIEAPEPAKPKQPRRTDGSNRVKYRCPVCQSQVWGKPDLTVLCGGDQCGGVRFEAVVAVAEVAPVFAPTPRPF